MEREQKRAEVAMRRRRGASKAHDEKVRSHMLAQDDLHTTCQGCKQQIRGTLTAIMVHMENCRGT